MEVFKNKYLLFVLLLYLSMFFGLFRGEDLLGAAEADYKGIKELLNIFRSDFSYYFRNYTELELRHSPVFQIFHIIILNLFNYDIIFKIINIHLNLIIVIVFYFSLKIQIKNYIKKNLIILSSIFFIMPSYRAYSIWPDSFLCGFLFFMLSVFFSLKFINCDDEKKNYFAYLNIISLAIASYVSPNFSVFSIFYLFVFYQYFSFSKNLLKIILINLILSLPAFFYIYIMENNFIDMDATKWIKTTTTFSITNLANKIIILPTIFIVYFVPFLIVNFEKIKSNFFLEIKKINFVYYILVISPLIMTNYFSFNEINSTLGGGGLFYNLLKFYDSHVIFLGIISSISILIILLLTNNNLKGKIFILCLILSNPQLTIYAVYFDLILFSCIFLFLNDGLLKIENLLNKIECIKVFFFYYFLILILHALKYQFYNTMQ